MGIASILPISTLDVTTENLVGYLDMMIAIWREKKLASFDGNDPCGFNEACCYIDAMQSVRVSFLGEELPLNERYAHLPEYRKMDESCCALGECACCWSDE